jgi:hypothetical protein
MSGGSAVPLVKPIKTKSAKKSKKKSAKQWNENNQQKYRISVMSNPSNINNKMSANYPELAL